MKYKYIILFCTIMILSVSAVSAAENTTGDIQIDDATGDLMDLENLINEETNDTVYLSHDYVGDSNNKTVVINKNITINGNGFSVDYLSNLPIFDIEASNVSIINMTIVRHHSVSGYYTDIFTGSYYPAVFNVNVIDKNDMPTIIGNDITKIYKNDTQYYVTIFDLNNQTLANTTVTFYLNDIHYNRTTDSNGRAKLNINLNPGTYIITAKNTNTTEIRENKIVVLPNIVENNDLEKYFRNNSQYVVKILNDDGTPAKANETVTFNINGVFYNRTTNETGHAKLNINLNPGEYIITAEYKGCKVSNKIKVKSILSAEDLSKKYGTPDQFKAKLVDGEGNPLANTNVTFNINGVFYNRTTDSDGIAKLNIRLMPGEYIITSSYNECYISNKITITA
ncbi:hypothetical protein [uncultured Methanobrevibacter sp.]|uniref:hypothetical protein n=1 Tax=uncultured Methanobrevibacter sp. TaxID=253161 RepID=UPI0025FB9770|nr:hypothetical protein [uncultured Methanobrevibacter sp.]